MNKAFSRHRSYSGLARHHHQKQHEDPVRERNQQLAAERAARRLEAQRAHEAKIVQAREIEREKKQQIEAEQRCVADDLARLRAAEVKKEPKQPCREMRDRLRNAEWANSYWRAHRNMLERTTRDANDYWEKALT